MMILLRYRVRDNVWFCKELYFDEKALGKKKHEGKITYKIA